MRASAAVAPAANVIERPSGEKRASNRLPLGCESTVCLSPVEIFIKSTFLVSEGLNVSRLDPSGDQSQILKQPFSSAGGPGGDRLCSATRHLLFSKTGNTSFFPSADNTGRYPISRNAVTASSALPFGSLTQISRLPDLLER